VVEDHSANLGSRDLRFYILRWTSGVALIRCRPFLFLATLPYRLFVATMICP
jgi:hypothetical protein